MRKVSIIVAAAAAGGLVGATVTRSAQPSSHPEWTRTLLVQIAVSDLDEAVSFYRDTLGFELESRDDDLNWARIKPGIANVTIGLGAGGAAQGSGTMSLNFSVADLDTARATLESRGVVFDGPTITVPGVVRLADLRDLDGNRIRLAQDIKR